MAEETAGMIETIALDTEQAIQQPITVAREVAVVETWLLELATKEL